jgi:hypothetical protein
VQQEVTKSATYSQAIGLIAKKGRRPKSPPCVNLREVFRS